MEYLFQLQYYYLSKCCYMHIRRPIEIHKPGTTVAWTKDINLYAIHIQRSDTITSAYHLNTLQYCTHRRNPPHNQHRMYIIHPHRVHQNNCHGYDMAH